MRRTLWLSLLSGVSLLLLAAGASAQTPAASNPPPNAGLFNAVTGNWAWEGTSCADSAHKLSFSENNTRMIYTAPKPFKSATGEMTSISRYRVLYAEENRITAYIEGETRRTAAGDRVIWVLVLQDPKTYVWRRTDWPAGNATKKILRCGS